MKKTNFIMQDSLCKRLHRRKLHLESRLENNKYSLIFLSNIQSRPVKTIFSLAILLSIMTTHLAAQTKLSGKVKYSCSIDIGMELSKFDAYLYCNNDSNYFQAFQESKIGRPFSNFEQNQIVKIDQTINIDDSIGLKIITDKRNDKIFSREILINKLIPVVEAIPKFKWNILDDTKQIGGILCQKATCTFRGRNYIAWFATEINIDAGPYKFQGLPGLILEVKDDKGLISFYATSIEYPYAGTIPINSTYSPAPILRQQYVDLAKQRMQRLETYLQSTVVIGAENVKSQITIKTKAIGLEDINEPL